MRFALMWLCIALAACSRESASLRDTSELVSELVQRMPRTTPYALRDDLHVLFTRSDATDAVIARYRSLPSDAKETLQLIRLATIAAAEHGHRKAVEFLLSVALQPEPAPKPSHRHGLASTGAPVEVMTRMGATSGLIAALVQGAAGAAEALDELLQTTDPWLAKTAAMEMAYVRVMDDIYSRIMATRGLVSRFRAATQDEARQRRTLHAIRTSTDQPPSF